MILRHLNKLKLILKDWLSMLSVDWEFLENWKEKWLIIIEEKSIQSKRFDKNGEWWWKSHFKQKNQKIWKISTHLSIQKLTILIKISHSIFIYQKICFWCCSELFKKAFWRSWSYPNVLESRESKMIGNKSKKKRNEG